MSAACLKREAAAKENAEENQRERAAKAVQKKCQRKAQPLLDASLSLYVRRFRSFIINIHMCTHTDTATDTDICIICGTRVSLTIKWNLKFMSFVCSLLAYAACFIIIWPVFFL